MSWTSVIRTELFGAVSLAVCACSSGSEKALDGSGGSTTLGGASSGGISNTAAGAGGASGSRATSNGAMSAGGSAVGGAANGGGANGGGANGGSVIGGGANGGRASGGSANGGSANGGSANGGTSGGGASGTGQGGQGGSDAFAFWWQDDFDTLDMSSWQLQTFTWAGNEAQFSTQNARVANGILNLALTRAPSGAAKPYLGVEMRSTRTLTYGKVSARMRFAAGSGVVSGLVLFYTPFPNCDWNEIDIEHLGNSSNTSQLNAMVYLGTPTPNCTSSVMPTQDPYIASLGLNAETDFHVYEVEWTPTGVKYFVDGALLRTWTANIARLRLAQNILLTIWASSAADWAGALTTSSVPTSADVDWIRLYRWNG